MLITVMRTADVWVQAVHHGGVGYFCVGCALRPDVYLGNTIQDCIAHLDEHRALGNVVDPLIYEELQRELELCGIANSTHAARLAHAREEEQRTRKAAQKAARDEEQRKRWAN